MRTILAGVALPALTIDASAQNKRPGLGAS